MMNIFLLQGSDGGRTVPLQEGEVRDIKIEVTAEDGTVKNYIVHVHRLSAKDATLSGIKLSQGTLKPDFSPITLEYSGNMLTHIINIQCPDEYYFCPGDLFH